MLMLSLMIDSVPILVSVIVLVSTTVLVSIMATDKFPSLQTDLSAFHCKR